MCQGIEKNMKAAKLWKSSESKEGGFGTDVCALEEREYPRGG